MASSSSSSKSLSKSEAAAVYSKLQSLINNSSNSITIKIPPFDTSTLDLKFDDRPQENYENCFLDKIKEILILEKDVNTSMGFYSTLDKEILQKRGEKNQLQADLERIEKSNESLQIKCRETQKKNM